MAREATPQRQAAHSPVAVLKVVPAPSLVAAALFTVTGNYSTSKGTATIDGTTYNTCVKMESTTSITFTLAESMKATFYFADTETASLKVDGEKKTATVSYYTETLSAGAHELTKADSRNLFGIKIEPLK